MEKEKKNLKKKMPLNKFFKIAPSAKLDTNLMLEKNAEKENKPADVTESCFLEEISKAKELVEETYKSTLEITLHLIASTEIDSTVAAESVSDIQELSDSSIAPKY